jgi:hypothetical protein
MVVWSTLNCYPIVEIKTIKVDLRHNIEINEAAMKNGTKDTDNFL